MLKPLFLLLVLLTLAACEDQRTPVGTWVGTANEQETKVVLRDNGMLYVKWGESENIGTWRIDDDGVIGFYDGDRDRGKARLVNDQLSVEDRGAVFILERASE
ncbi:MAG: hypothetical protein AB8F65_00070 [Woeseiaceae bacterium]